MTSYVLGIDGGGTHTICVILDDADQVIARSQSGPSNHQSVGLETTQKNLAEAIRLALKDAGEPSLAAACMGMAGLDRPEDEILLRQVASTLFLDTPFLVEHDATIALVGGTGGERFGLVIISGTGSIAVGFNQDGQHVRSGGWGHLLGDEGSGYDIALRGLNAATRAQDGRGSSTVLVERLPSAAEEPSLEGLSSRIYLENWDTPTIARLAPVVTQAAAEGDAVAVGIVKRAGEELALAARVVIQRLGMSQETFDIVLSGGVFKAKGLLVETLRQMLKEVAPDAQVIYPRYEPVIGAALMARALAREQLFG